jgi:hypothetical protein
MEIYTFIKAYQERIIFYCMSVTSFPSTKKIYCNHIFGEYKRPVFRDSYKTQFMDQIVAYLLLKPA